MCVSAIFNILYVENRKLAGYCVVAVVLCVRSRLEYKRECARCFVLYPCDFAAMFFFSPICSPSVCGFLVSVGF